MSLGTFLLAWAAACIGFVLGCLWAAGGASRRNAGTMQRNVW